MTSFRENITKENKHFLPYVLSYQIIKQCYELFAVSMDFVNLYTIQMYYRVRKQDPYDRLGANKQLVLA